MIRGSCTGIRVLKFKIRVKCDKGVVHVNMGTQAEDNWVTFCSACTLGKKLQKGFAQTSIITRILL